VLLILTNVEGAYRAFGTERQELLRELTVAEAEALLETASSGRQHGPEGRGGGAFVRGGGSRAIIGPLDQGLAACRARPARSSCPESQRPGRASRSGRDCVQRERKVIMNIHEYQARDILSAHGVPVPPGEVATTPRRRSALRPSSAARSSSRRRCTRAVAARRAA
jgi:hypothetical protein